MGTRLDMIGIFVADIGRMVEFYRDVLMFEVDWDGESPYAEFKNDGVRMSMYERRMLPELLGQEPTYPSGLNGTFELAIDMPLLEDVDPTFERLVALGARPVYAPRNEPWGDAVVDGRGSGRQPDRDRLVEHRGRLKKPGWKRLCSQPAGKRAFQKPGFFIARPSAPAAPRGLRAGRC